MSLIFATQFSAVATAILAFFAIVTGIFAILAFRKQAKEVSDQAKMLEVQSKQLEVQSRQFNEGRKVDAEQIRVLKLQAKDLGESLDERKREAAERHRAQASRILITEIRHPYIRDPAVITGGIAYVEATISNGSSAPIHDTELRWHQGSAPYGQPNPEPLGMIMPHDAISERREFPENADLDVCGAVLTFRDDAGIKWQRRPDGSLVEQDG